MADIGARQQRKMLPVPTLSSEPLHLHSSEFDRPAIRNAPQLDAIVRVRYFLPEGHDVNNIFLIMIAAAVVSGCASVNSVRDAHETKGEQRSFDVSYPDMLSMAETTLSSLGIGIVDTQTSDSGSTVFLGTDGVTFSSWGEIIRVTVSKSDPANTSVTVYWRHRFRDGLVSFTRDWTEDIFADIEKRAADLNVPSPNATIDRCSRHIASRKRQLGNGDSP